MTCLRGASAVASILGGHGAARVRVFAIWEPILPTDFSPPTTFAMHRISDPRVRQYWDPDHIVARQLAADAHAPQPAPECCDRSGVLWDLAAVYPAGASWNDRMPPATIFNGPVVDVASQVESALTGPERQ